MCTGRGDGGSVPRWRADLYRSVPFRSLMVLPNKIYTLNHRRRHIPDLLCLFKEFQRRTPITSQVFTVTKVVDTL